MALPVHLISVQPFSSTDSISLTSNGRAAVHNQVIHEELRVVGTTLFHCDIAQQVVIARYTVPEGTRVGPGGTAVFAPFEVNGHFTRGLCILQSNNQYLEVHLPSIGECSVIPLPVFNHTSSGEGHGYVNPALWPLDIGVSLSFDVPVSSLGEGRVPQLPLFTLTNPLDEPRPVFEVAGHHQSSRMESNKETTQSLNSPQFTSPQSAQKLDSSKALNGIWKVVFVERKNEWPMALVVAVETGSGRRAIWSLRRLLKEGFEGGRYAARNHAHRKDKQGWRSGAVTGETNQDVESSILAEEALLYDLPEWSMRDSNTISSVGNKTGATTLDFGGSMMSTVQTNNSLENAISNSTAKRIPAFLDTTSRVSMLSATSNDASMNDSTIDNQFLAECIFSDDSNIATMIRSGEWWWWIGLDQSPETWTGNLLWFEHRDDTKSPNQMPAQILCFSDPRKGVVSSLQLSFLNEEGESFDNSFMAKWNRGVVGSIDPECSAVADFTPYKVNLDGLLRSGCNVEVSLHHSGFLINPSAAQTRLTGWFDVEGSSDDNHKSDGTCMGLIPRISRLALCLLHSESGNTPSLVLTDMNGFTHEVRIIVSKSALTYFFSALTPENQRELFVNSPLIEASMQLISETENDQFVTLKPLRVMRSAGRFVDVLCEAIIDQASLPSKVVAQRLVYRVEIKLNPDNALLADVLPFMDSIFDHCSCDGLKNYSKFHFRACIKASLSLDFEDSEWTALLRALATLLRAEVGSDTPSSCVGSRSEISSSPWEQLLQSEFHADYDKANGIFFPSDLSPNASIQSEVNAVVTDGSIPFIATPGLAPLKSDEMRRGCALHVLYSLHMLHEDRKLDSMTEWQCRPLRRLLSALASALGLDQYKEFYDREDDCFKGEGEEKKLLEEIKSLQLISNISSTPNISPVLSDPPCIRSHLLLLTEAIESTSVACAALKTLAPFPLPMDTNLCLRSRQVCRVFEAMCAPLYNHHLVGSNNAVVIDGKQTDIYMKCMQSCVSVMVQCGLSSSKMSTMPTGIAMPLFQALRMCRVSPPIAWSSSCFKRCGRPDLAAMVGEDDGGGEWVAVEREDDENSMEQEENNSNEIHSVHLKRNVLHSMLQSKTHDKHHRASSMDCDVMTSYPSLVEIQGITEEPDLSAKQPKAWTESAEDHDGLVHLESSTSVRFAHDLRVSEVCRLLRSSRSHYLNVHRPPEVSDIDYIQLQQSKLMLLVTRSLASCLGRGAVTLATLKPRAPLSQALPIPTICLLGRTPPRDTLVKLDFTSTGPNALTELEMLTWPSFHNGVAAGLRLAKGSYGEWQVTRNWIMFNSPPHTSVPPPGAEGDTRTPASILEAELNKAARGGMLLALGIHGHLGSLNKPNLYSYFKEGHEATSVGLLIGLGCQHKGTSNKSASLTIRFHIPHTYEAQIGDAISTEISPACQCAALVALGYVFMGTNNRQICEFLITELGQSSSNECRNSMESYSLCCGFALGLVTLGTSNEESTSPFEESASSNSPMNSGNIAALPIEQRLLRYVTGGKSEEVRDRSEGCVLVGSSINTNVTAPGATIALALCYLKSNNSEVADRLKLPDTHPMLDYVRPDLLRLRVLARSLIMWDQVSPSVEWVLNQVPVMVRDAWKALGARAVHASSSFSHLDPSNEEEDIDSFFDASDIKDFCDISSSAALSSSTSTATSPQTKAAYKANGRAIEAALEGVDVAAVKQAHANCIAGALMGIAMRFAGTSDEGAKQTLLFFSRHFKSLRDNKHDASCIIYEESESMAGSSLAAMLTARRPDKVTLETCVGLGALALGCVMAGTGDLDSLKLIRSLYFKVDGEVTYGNHCATQLALGLLFLGGGELTLGRSNEQIASLVISLFPFFPANPNDNRYHLQALRQLYAMAAEPRSLVAVDANTGMPVFIPLKVTVTNKPIIMKEKEKADGGQLDLNECECIELVAPCLLSMDLKRIVRVQINSERYHKLDLWPMRYATHANALESRRLVVKRKEGFKSLDVGLLNSDQKSHTQERIQLSSSLQEDPYLLAFFNHLAPSRSDSTGNQPLAQPFQQLLKLCLKFSSTDALSALLPLACFQTPYTGKEGRHLAGGDLSVAGIWSLRFLVAHTKTLCAVEARMKAVQDAPDSSSVSWLSELHPIPPQRVYDILTHLTDWLTSTYPEISNRLVSYLQCGDMKDTDDHHNLNPLSIYLTLHNCPTPSQFKHLLRLGDKVPSIARMTRQFPLTPVHTLLLIRRLALNPNQK